MRTATAVLDTMALELSAKHVLKTPIVMMAQAGVSVNRVPWVALQFTPLLQHVGAGLDTVEMHLCVRPRVAIGAILVFIRIR